MFLRCLLNVGKYGQRQRYFCAFGMEETKDVAIWAKVLNNLGHIMHDALKLDG
jgi:hypothetical protein